MLGIESEPPTYKWIFDTCTRNFNLDLTPHSSFFMPFYRVIVNTFIFCDLPKFICAIFSVKIVMEHVAMGTILCKYGFNKNHSLFFIILHQQNFNKIGRTLKKISKVVNSTLCRILIHKKPHPNRVKVRFGICKKKLLNVISWHCPN